MSSSSSVRKMGWRDDNTNRFLQKLYHASLFKLTLAAITGLPIIHWFVKSHHPWDESTGKSGKVEPTQEFLTARFAFRHFGLKLLRLFLFLLFVLTYIWTLTHANAAKKTAPVVEQGRISLFAEAEDNIEELISQGFTKSLTPFMPGPDAAAIMNSLQSKCRMSAFQTDPTLNKEFECDFIKIEFSGMRKSPYRGIPCSNKKFMSQIVSHGDFEPYDELPSIVKKIYSHYNISDSDQFPPQFGIGSGYPLFNPLFSSEREKGKFAPLPMLNAKLNSLARKLKISSSEARGLFDDDPWQFEQATGLPMTPRKSRRHRSVERNHHWDLAFMCEPQELVVSFKVWTKRSAVPLWWRYRISFFSTGRNLQYFQAALHVKTSTLSYDTVYHSAVDSLVPIFVLISLFVSYLIPALVAVCLFPLNLCNLIFRRGNFKRIISDFLDPLRTRLIFTPSVCISFENAGVICLLIGLVLSLIEIFTISGASYYDEKLQVAVSPYYMWTHNLNLPTSKLISQILFGIWCNSSWHSAAAVFFILRLSELSLMFEGTSCVLLTFFFAFIPVVHFCFIFGLLMLAFGIVLFNTYGCIYPQYCTLGRCLWSILLFSFSFSEQSMTDSMVQPLIEDSAIFLQVILLAFQILVVIIFLNMFTTIIIDAYQVACDRGSSPAKMSRLKAAMWYRAKFFFGFYDELREEEEILGGRPGPLFFRATVADEENPLDIEEDVDSHSLLHDLENAISAIEAVKPLLHHVGRRRNMTFSVTSITDPNDHIDHIRRIDSNDRIAPGRFPFFADDRYGSSKSSKSSVGDDVQLPPSVFKRDDSFPPMDGSFPPVGPTMSVPPRQQLLERKEAAANFHLSLPPTGGAASDFPTYRSTDSFGGGGGRNK